MTTKQLDNQELAKVSADLDAELEQLFDEMETILAASPEEWPQLEFLPDEEDDPRLLRSRPPGRPQQEPPILTRRHAPTEDDYEKQVSEISPGKRGKIKPAAPEPPAAPRAIARGAPEFSEAETSADNYKPPSSGFKETIATLSPDDFFRLTERAVARGVLAALKKWRRPAED